MKNILLFVFVLLLFPVFAFAGQNSAEQHWVCFQPGHLDGAPTLVISTSAEFVDDHDAKEKNFELMTKQLGLQPDYSGRCQEFTSKKEAEKFQKKLLKAANKRRINVVWLAPILLLR